MKLKFTILNKMIILAGIALLVLFLFGGRGTWDAFVYLVTIPFLIVLTMIDIFVQLVFFNKKSKKDNKSQ